MGLGLHPVFSLAHEIGAIDARRYVDLVVKLAWRRHGHLALNVATMLSALRGDVENGLENFRAVANFIGTRNAELRSHIDVTTAFLDQLWRASDRFDLRCKQATSALLERIIRFRSKDWALVLAFLKRGSAAAVRQYIDGWIVGRFLPAGEVAAAVREIDDVARRLHAKHPGKGQERPILVRGKRRRHRQKRR